MGLESVARAAGPARSRLRPRPENDSRAKGLLVPGPGITALTEP
jgi:hypothetical protein